MMRCGYDCVKYNVGSKKATDGQLFLKGRKDSTTRSVVTLTDQWTFSLEGIWNPYGLPASSP